MKAVFYRYLIRATKLFGPVFFAMVAQGIATGYFLFNTRRRTIGREFYAALFPEKSRLYHYISVWRQFTSFTYLYLDRFIQREVRNLDYTIQGREHVVAAHDGRKGGILLMSHMGNWEVAAHLLTKVLPNVNLMLYMGIRDKEEIEKIQKQSICRDGIHIIGVDQNGGSPFDIVEGIRFLQNGGLVSMAGDVVWRDDQRTIAGEFLGRRVRIPEAPFVLALVSGAPLIVFFAFRTPEGRYRFSALPPIRVTAATRQDRPAALKSAAQRYLGYMEAALAEYPYQWFHFKRFI
ncbi:MAG: lysophospholipid acyltransferase family protein [Desulfobacteraceae bacterium]|jgi:predicted LPLAT superfamily acyltransferase